MITSKSNPIVKDLILLRDKSRARRDRKLFVVEGLRMFQEVPAGWLRDLFVTERFLEKNEMPVGEKAGGCRVTVLSDAVFAHVSDTKTPQGVLCVLSMPEYSREALLSAPRRSALPGGREAAGRYVERDRMDADACADRMDAGRMGAGMPLILILEGIQDPGNLGTLVRSAEGAGATGILLDPGCADLFGPKAVRATMGSIFRVPFAFSDDLREDIRRLGQQGVMTCAACLPGSVCYDEPDYTGGCAFLIGNEGNGLSEETAMAADLRIRIPMSGQLESLNAAVSGSLLLYEAARQRRR